MKIEKLDQSSWKLDGVVVMMRHQQDLKDFLLIHKDALASITQKSLPKMKNFPTGSLNDIKATCDSSDFVKVLIEKMQQENFLIFAQTLIRVISLVKVASYVNSIVFSGEDEKNFSLISFILYQCKQAMYTTESDWEDYQHYQAYVLALKYMISPMNKGGVSLEEMPKGKNLPTVPVLLLKNPLNYLNIDKEDFIKRVMYGMSKIVKMNDSSDILVEFFGITLLNPFEVDFDKVKDILSVKGGSIALFELKIGATMYNLKAIAESEDEKSFISLRLLPSYITFKDSENLKDVFKQ